MNDIALHRSESGNPDGRPIVAIHGANGTGETWTRMAIEGLPHLRWICPDLRGHGHSESVKPWTIEQFAVDIVSLLDSFGLKDVDMIGHSLGAVVATEVCKQAQSRIRNVIMIDPLLMTESEEFDFINVAKQGTSQDDMRAQTRTLEEAVDNRMKLAVGCRKPVVPVDARPYALLEERARLVQVETGELTSKARITLAEAGIGIGDLARHALPALKDYMGRILLISARNSGFCTAAGIKAMQIQQVQAGGQFSFFEVDSGHEVLWEKYHDCVRVIRTFLSNH